MSMRKITSLTATLSFIFLVTTSVVLYIVPHGRVAYWSDWHLWGLSKTQWGNIHINLGLLFVLAILLHLYYNWKAIVSYLKDRTKRIKVFTKSFNLALLIVLAFMFGTYVEIPPFAWVLDVNETLKDSAAKKHGEPPYGHAELSSLKTLTARVELDLAQSVARLKTAGIKFDRDKQTILEIAKLNKMSPRQVYLAMLPPKGISQINELPEIPPPGLGKRSLADICQQYNLNIPIILRGLADRDIKASADMSIKKIAEHAKMSPIDVYEAIKDIAGKK